MDKKIVRLREMQIELIAFFDKLTSTVDLNWERRVDQLSDTINDFEDMKVVIDSQDAILGKEMDRMNDKLVDIYEMI